METERATVDRAFVRHADFYRETYAAAVTRYRRFGGLGTTVLHARQHRGDWSDAATPDLTIAFMTSRSVDVSMDLCAGRFHGVQPRNSFIVIAPNAATSIQMEGPHEVECVSIPYRTLLASDRDGDLPADGDFGALHGFFFEDRLIRRVTDQLIDEARRTESHGAFFIDGLIMQIAGRLATLARRRTRSDSNTACHRAIRRAEQFLGDNLDANVSVLELCREVDLSPTQLHVLFKAKHGTAPHQWHLKRRLDQAAALLRDTDRTMTEIGYACGFASSQHFAATFRYHRGCSPSQFRQSSRS